MMVAKSYYNPAQLAESFKRLDDLRTSGETCDISLLASNKKIRAHKLVLASASEYFKNAIYGLFLSDSGKDELEINEIQYEILSMLVNYIYSGQIDINSENVYAIYDAADYCLMKFLKEVCLDFMVENLDIDNCLKLWIRTNNCKNEKPIIASGNYILSNLAPLSDTKEFLTLSNEELLDLFSLWPKHELFDPIITAALKWAANKDNWEETIINIFKDISHTNISEDFLENCLSTNEFIQNSIGCNKWMIKIFNEYTKFNKLKEAESKAKQKKEFEQLKLEQAESEGQVKQKLTSEIEKLKLQQAESEAKLKLQQAESKAKLKLQQAQSEAKQKLQQTQSEAKQKLQQAESAAKLKLQQAESEAKLKFTKFLLDHPIIFMTHDDDDGNASTFYKYIPRDGTLSLYNQIKDVQYYDCKAYKNWIYAVGNYSCGRFAFDDINKNTFETGFHHDHGPLMSAAVLNDSLYIFGGTDSMRRGSRMDLNTNQFTSFRLLENRRSSGIAVCDGTIYICGGWWTNIVERFDPRDGATTRFGSVPFNNTSPRFYAAATLPHQIYCTNGEEYAMMDLRNNIWINSESTNHISSGKSRCLASSHTKVYSIIEGTIVEYSDTFKNWERIVRYTELCKLIAATSYE